MTLIKRIAGLINDAAICYAGGTPIDFSGVADNVIAILRAQADVRPVYDKSVVKRLAEQMGLIEAAEKRGAESAKREAGKHLPCKGMNCGCTDGVSHSAECQAEHAAAIAGRTFVKAAQQQAEPSEGFTVAEVIADFEKVHGAGSVRDYQAQQAEPGADERAAFEAWIMGMHPNAHEDVSEQRVGDDYVHQSTTRMWEAWKESAKRAAQSGQQAAVAEDKRADHKRLCWLLDNPSWRVTYEIPRGGHIRWAITEEGERWGNWYAEPRAAIDAAMLAIDPTQGEPK